jgi:predicted glycogen debranching enzyme
VQLTFGRGTLADERAAARREWLVTNGIGGYACGTLSGELTRRYHGLLVAALAPPVARRLVLVKLIESITVDGRTIALDTNRWASGAVAPRGLVHLEAFRLERTVPRWTWSIGDVRIDKRVWMEQGANITHVRYRLSAGHAPVRLSLEAIVDRRDSHDTTPGAQWKAAIEPIAGGVRVTPADGPALWLLAAGATVRATGEWYRDFALAVEDERGLDAIDDHLFAARIEAALTPGDALTVTAGVGGAPPERAPGRALARRRAHERALVAAWNEAQPTLARTAPGWIRQLVLAADAYVVRRPGPDGSGGSGGRSVIAGYPWFTDWGRDTMISLPGLTLVTGRPAVARGILETYARWVDQGMLPNVFPDGEAPPEYDTVDAPLWFVQAVRAYATCTHDWRTVESLMPALEEIGAWYERGTRHGIGVDPSDGLVHQGEPGVALTWMDARWDGHGVTPRTGKPVEINALWYAALVAMAAFAHQLGRSGAGWARRAEQVRASFARFWNPAAGALFDVLDGPDGDDPALRPNQLFALSLEDSPLLPGHRAAVLAACGRTLLTSHGMRTLDPAHPGYWGRYVGDRLTRDRAYHQGTVWTWLLPHHALAHFRVHGDRAAALALLEPLGTLAGEMGIGQLPEVCDGDPPHTPRGCFAQAWSVAETLRAWHAIAGAGAVPAPVDAS